MKKYSKILAVLFSFLILFSSFTFSVTADELSEDEAAPLTGVTINVYNWGEYISNGTDGSLDVNAEFTRRTGIQVNYTTFDSNESLSSKLAGGGADYAGSCVLRQKGRRIRLQRRSRQERLL